MTIPLNKHQQTSAKTREAMIATAEVLYGSRGIDAVSLSEITAASGQKNRNALQYHFKNRQGLLEAIFEKNTLPIGELRKNYLERAATGEWPPAEAAARCLAMPIIDYIDSNPQAVNFVLIVSQLSPINQIGSNQGSTMGVNHPSIPILKRVLDDALRKIPAREAQRRIYLAVNITFHSIADIYRISNDTEASRTLTTKGPMVEQLICVLESFFAAPSKKKSSK